jgi:hypothetical protein
LKPIDAAIRRSVLITPGARPEGVKAAAAQPCDSVVIDLEDGVAPNAKMRARESINSHIDAAVKSFESTCGWRPVGWHCRYGPSDNTRELLIEEGGFEYDSDAYNDDLPHYLEVHGQSHLIAQETLFG